MLTCFGSKLPRSQFYHKIHSHWQPCNESSPNLQDVAQKEEKLNQPTLTSWLFFFQRQIVQRRKKRQGKAKEKNTPPVSISMSRGSNTFVNWCPHLRRRLRSCRGWGVTTDSTDYGVPTYPTQYYAFRAYLPVLKQPTEYLQEPHTLGSIHCYLDK